MQTLIKKIAQIILISFTFALAVNTHADGNDKRPECGGDNTHQHNCSNYIKGYLDALQKINTRPVNNDKSAFQQRALEMRLLRANEVNPLKEKLGLCLPASINSKEVHLLLTSNEHNLPLDKALLKTLQVNFPC